MTIVSLHAQAVAMVIPLKCPDGRTPAPPGSGQHFAHSTLYSKPYMQANPGWITPHASRQVAQSERGEKRCSYNARCVNPKSKLN